MSGEISAVQTYTPNGNAVLFELWSEPYDMFGGSFCVVGINKKGGLIWMRPCKGFKRLGFAFMRENK